MVVAEIKHDRKCGDSRPHQRHEYSHIDLHGRNIGFGQTFVCPGKQGVKLTGRERDVLKAIAKGPAHWIVFIHGTGSDHTPQGCHQTAASLVRKGMATRQMTGRYVSYTITPAGKGMITTPFKE